MEHLEQGFKDNAKYDLPAGLVVFLVALPLCLGIALASGAPLFAGIISGIIGGIVIGYLSGSELSVSGPAAGLAVIVLDAITDLQMFEIFLAAVVVSGIFQILFSILRLGAFADFVPNSVIKGMLAGIGVVIFLKQIPHALGRDSDYQGDLDFVQSVDGLNTFSEILVAFQSYQMEAVIISIVSLAILILWEQPSIKDKSWSLYLPGPLVVVIVGIMINEFMGWVTDAMYLEPGSEHMVNLPVAASLGEFFQQFKNPMWSAFTKVDVWTTGLVIAIVGSIETLLCIEATDKLDPYKRISKMNKELRAQGIGNILSGMIGGLPITSVIVRSSANVYSGARTRQSAIFHGFLLLLASLLIPNLLNLIPLASLAAILLVIGYKLARISLFQRMYADGYDQFLPFVVTVLAIVFTDLLTGIAIGLVIGIFFVVRTNYYSSLTLVNQDNYYLMRFNKDMSFVHKTEVKRSLRSIPENSTIVIDGSRASVIDNDISEAIEDFRSTAQMRDIKVECKNLSSKAIHVR